jgi:hypothetical protein
LTSTALRATVPRMALTGNTAGPAQARRHCTHDSTRVDGFLDDHCLRCGRDGYWQNGIEANPAGRQTKGHPSGKTLLAA